MNKTCYLCGEEFLEDELVELTVIAPFHKIKSKVNFSIGHPVEAYGDTMRHNLCPVIEG